MVDRDPPLTARERWTALLIGLACIAVSGLVAWPLESLGGAGFAAVVFDAFVFGGLLGAAGVVVYIDRRQAAGRRSRCPRCGLRPQEGACDRCGYDLDERPRYACEQRHVISYDDGVCPCGRRLHRLEEVRGLGPQVRRTLYVGAWLLAFLLGVGWLLSVTNA